MTTALLDGTVTDDSVGKIPVPGALIYVYNGRGQDGGLSSLFDKLAQSIENPVVADENGYWSAYAESDQFYTLVYYWGGRKRYVESNVLLGDAAINTDPNVRADLASDADGSGAALVGTTYAVPAQSVMDALAGPVFPLRLKDIIPAGFQSGAAVDCSAALQTWLNTNAADPTAPRVGSLELGDYMFGDITIPAGMQIISPDLRPGAMNRYTRVTPPPGATCFFKGDTTTPSNGAAIRGLWLQGNTANGFVGIDFANNATQPYRCAFDCLQVTDCGDQGMKLAVAQSMLQSLFVYYCVAYRTRSDIIAAVELSGPDNSIKGLNEFGVSAQVGLAGADNTAARAFMNANTPRLWGLWLKGGAGGAGNTLMEGENNCETSEGGFLNDGSNGIFKVRAELNLAYGIWDRGSGNRYYTPAFDTNSCAGTGLYPNMKIDASVYGAGAKARVIEHPLVKRTGNVPGVWTGTAQFPTIDIQDNVYTLAGGTGYQCERTVVFMSRENRCKVTSDDPMGVILPNLDARPNNGQNAFPNSALTGAVLGVIGSGGALPTGMVTSTVPGITQEVTGFGDDNGIPYVEIYVHGTVTGGSNVVYLCLFDGNTYGNRPAAANGETWTGSMGYQLVSNAGATSLPFIVLGMQECTATGDVGALVTKNIDVGLALTDYLYRTIGMCRQALTKTLSGGATVRRVRFHWQTTLNNGAAYDFKYRVAIPQLERAALMGEPILTYGKAAIPRMTDFNAPATGATVSMSPRSEALILKPAGTIATLTVNLPEAPQDGDVVTISTTQTITALTLSAVTAGYTISGAATTLNANTSVRYKFSVSAGNIWVVA